MLRAALISFAFVSSTALPAFADPILKAEQLIEVAVVEVDENGQEQVSYEAASEIAPGEELRYRLNYANTGDEAAEDIVLVMPIPSQVTFLEGSVEAGEAAVEYSADNGETFASRGDLTVQTGDQEKPVTSEDLTHVKWVFSEAIEPGVTGNISFRGVLK